MLLLQHASKDTDCKRRLEKIFPTKVACECIFIHLAMQIFKILFWTLWRIWFYLYTLTIILLLFPFLVVSILKASWYPYFFKLARVWAQLVMLGMGFYVRKTLEEKPKPNQSYMLVANHTSMIDIMLMLYLFPNNPFVFVGKKELSKLPIFGFFYKRTCILVDRNSPKSRQEVFRRAQEKLNMGLSVCIFPEGGVPDRSVFLDQFKDGAFRLAIEHQIPILPVTLPDVKKRFPFEFFAGEPGKLRAHFHKSIPTDGLTLADKASVRDKTRAIIETKLTEMLAD